MSAVFTIRRSTASDLPVLMSLWQEVFGDPPAFTSKFYHTFGADCAFVAEIDEKIVAMIHALPTALAQNGQYSWGVYLYALATSPDYRGLGIASALLQTAEASPYVAPLTLSCAENAGLSLPHVTDSPAFALLIPGEESLVGYYRKRGYDRTANIRKDDAPDYRAHLTQGMGDTAVFLKPEPFYDLSVKTYQPDPLLVTTALWKATDPSIPVTTPYLSRFMQ